MKRDEMIAQIALILNQMLQDRGETSREIGAHTRLLGGELPVDSLDLATVVVQLEEMTGQDPFRDGFIEFRTVGELAALYSADAGRDTRA